MTTEIVPINACITAGKDRVDWRVWLGDCHSAGLRGAGVGTVNVSIDGACFRLQDYLTAEEAYALADALHVCAEQARQRTEATA